MVWASIPKSSPAGPSNQPTLNIFRSQALVVASQQRAHHGTKAIPETLPISVTDSDPSRPCLRKPWISPGLFTGDDYIIIIIIIVITGRACLLVRGTCVLLGTCICVRCRWMGRERHGLTPTAEILAAACTGWSGVYACLVWWYLQQQQQQQQQQQHWSLCSPSTSM